MFEEALEYARRGFVSGAVERNREYAGQYVTAAGVEEARLHLLYDPQTSGGLLLCVTPERAEELIGRLHAAGQVTAAIIGRIVEKSEGRIMVTNDGESTCCCGDSDREREGGTNPAPASACCASATEPCCCSGGETGVSAPAKFGEFMAAVNAGGTLSLREKELMALALSVLAKCEACVKIHHKKAVEAGLTEAEIEEAAWMGIAFGGAPTMMWYNGVKEEIQ